MNDYMRYQLTMNDYMRYQLTMDDYFVQFSDLPVLVCVNCSHCRLVGFASVVVSSRTYAA